jgi:hypothetical protein
MTEDDKKRKKRRRKKKKKHANEHLESIRSVQKEW